MTYVDVDGVSKIYDNGVTALTDVRFSAERGEFVSIVGPSGCGKSTLLRIVAGLRKASHGSVTINGLTVSDPIRVGMVFQTPALMAWKNALDNVLVACDLAGLKVSDYEERARQLLALVGLEDFAGAAPSELSGGMQQRVALCRALIHDADLLLMDEPFGALDALTRDEMNLELLRVLKKAGRQKTVLFVTHSIPEAVFLSDRILVMSARPGEILADTRSVLERPREMRMRMADDFGRQVVEIYELLHSRNGARMSEDAGRFDG